MATDGGIVHAIDFDKLRQELSSEIVEGREERYQFTWPDKKKAILLANSPINATLRPCREESVDFDNTQNLYIEGDNLDVLKCLKETYLGKVKMIYIDPPYNTGNDFVYEDDFAESTSEYLANSGQYDEQGNRLVTNSESNGRFHTDWLNMMYPRLKVARDLLTDDGVIFINMDENEITNLQKICVELFGEANDLGTIVWDKRNPKGDAKGISYQHEYILVYAKDIFSFISKCKLQRQKRNAQTILNKAKSLFNKISSSYSLENCNDDFGEWMKKQTDFSGGEKAYNRIDENGEPYQAVSMSWPNKKKAPDDYFIPLIHPITKKKCPVPERGWRNPSSTMKSLEKESLIIFGADESIQPRRKYLLKDNILENIPSLLYYGGSDTELLKEMGIPFDTPKVVSICMEHIYSLADKESIILDFFSGSATTAHAVMQLNAKDGGKRKFIMVQLPEKTEEKSEAFRVGYKNICEIGKERIRRAGKQIKENLATKVQEGIVVEQNEEKKIDVGFRVLKLDSSNMEDIYYSPTEYTQSDLFAKTENVKLDRTSEDLLFQVMLELGATLDSKIEQIEIEDKTIYNIANNYLVACFDNEIDDSAVTAIAKMQPQYAVFRDSSMVDDSTATNFEQIFKTYSPNTVTKVL